MAALLYVMGAWVSLAVTGVIFYLAIQLGG